MVHASDSHRPRARSPSRAAQRAAAPPNPCAAAAPRIGGASRSAPATGAGTVAKAASSHIVADDNGCCVFVEVRSRTGEDKGHPLESITPQKRAHVIRAARLYLEAESPSAAAYRFDVVAVTFWPDDCPPSLLHIPHAFETS